MTRSLVWFRNDLRTVDHPPLHAAVSESDGSGAAFGFYCFDERHFAKSPFGFDRTGPHRTRFLLESVADLRDQFRRLGGELIIRVGRPEDALAELIEALSIDQVHFHQDVGTEEQAVERRVASVCNDHGVRSRSLWSSTLYSPDDLPFKISELPELFTQFRKEIEKSSQYREPIEAPEKIVGELPPGFSIGELPTAHDLDIPDPSPDERAHRQYEGGQTAGLDRLDEYIWRHDRLRVYKQTRNGMLNVDDSSKLSLWLANGSLSPRTVAAEVARYERERVANDSTYWLIFELMWRDYFRFITAKHGRKLFQVGGIRQTAFPWDQDRDRFAAWKNGRTGYPLVDANMLELAATGYMSNRGRQNVGSFLTKNLGLDWRMGAQWFESMLIDYDVASNYGNWNYVAGVGNDARGFRFFNITKQSKDYDADGNYVRHWLPELANVPKQKIHEPWTLTVDEQTRFGVRIGTDYPRPIVDLFESAKANERKYNPS